MTPFFRRALVALVPLLVGAVSLAIAPIVFAQGVDPGLQEVGSVVQLSAADPRVIAARIINVVLGLLGIIMVSLMVYAGFLWMTAGGNADQLERAKNIIRNAIIGLIIVMMSWAIATYVIRAIFGATEGTGGTSGTGPGGGPGGGLGGSGAGSGFQIQSLSPTGTTTIRNIEVRFLFNRPVAQPTAAAALTVVRLRDNAPVAGTLSVSGQLATFVPTAACPAPQADRKCFDAGEVFEIRVANTLRSEDGRSISCTPFTPPCRVRFETGTVVDTTPPQVNVTSPAAGQSVNASSVVRIVAEATDDAGVSLVEGFVDNVSIGRSAPSGATPRTFQGVMQWDPTGATIGTHAVRASANDVDSNVGQSAPVSFALRYGHCFNAVRDSDETGIDCGGSRCGACSGGTCSSGADCRSGVCQAGRCVEQPVVTNLSPRDGRPGTFVTISGYNFGTSGEVRFWNGSAFAVVALPPAQCGAAGTWTGSQVLVAVPVTAQSGPIQLTNGQTSLRDATNDANGPRLSDFTVNTVTRPGICAITPTSGAADTEVRVSGAGFGGTRGATDRLVFGETEPSSYVGWTDTEIRGNAPRVSPGSYPVSVKTATTESNAVNFDLIVPARTEPTIETVDPVAGPIGTYVTLSGRNFGSRVGVVRFQNIATGDVGTADVTFPAQCSTNWWRDTVVTVKVPATLGAGALGRPVGVGNYRITLERDGVSSNAVGFEVRTGTAAPGICAIEPIAGPVGVTTTAYGERFGGSAGQVTFQGAGTRVTASDVAEWQSNRFDVRVPNGSRTGAVKVRVGGQDSNGVAFTVANCQENPTAICGAGRECCANGVCAAAGTRCSAGPQSAMYAWRVSTGVIPVNPRVVEQCETTGATPLPPSPAPWDARTDGQNVCLNAAVTLRFNVNIVPGSLTNNVIVRKCTGTGANPCTAATNVAGSLTLRSAGTPGEYVYFVPTAPLEANATYEVQVRQQIQALGTNLQMEPQPSCGTGFGYCYRFRTGGPGATCQIQRVSVTPPAPRLTEPGATQDMDALPMTNGCVALSNAINWRWYAGRSAAPADQDSRATVTNTVLPSGNVASTQRATAVAETGATPVQLSAETVIPGQSPVRGYANLYINFVPPRIVTFGPSCQEACGNAAIYATFNVPMDPARLSANRVFLRKCTNENCDAYEPSTPITLCDSGVTYQDVRSGDRTITNGLLNIEPRDPARGCAPITLEAGRYYRVTVRNGTDGVFARNGLPLSVSETPANASAEGFTWTFRVKTTGGGRCVPSRVDVVPGEKIESLVGARQSFQATPVSAPDTCNAAGQRLVVDQSFSWNVQDGLVARLLNGRGGATVDTTNVLPANCSSQCLLTGANGALGRVANCGNSAIETTDGQYCRNGAVACAPGAAGCRTIHGDPCVVLAPGSRGGEQCDLGAANGAPGSLCSAQCTWTGATGAACGNGLVDRGEQCDAQRLTCAGGVNAGATCVRDADCGVGGTCTNRVPRPGCSSQCVAQGSIAGGSVCGEGSIGFGETCDDGNTSSGDGCSSMCLHEGSVRVSAICGNGVREPGEACEVGAGGVWPARCDRTTCLNQGTDRCAPAAPGAPVPANCCGNNVRDAGEDCDDNSGGCSERCLLKGSSASYAAPSFCGDGLPLGTGEQCEATTLGDGLVDSRQLAEIVGRGTVGANNIMSTQIRTTYETVNGSAVYGVACGKTREREDCNAGAPYVNGLTDQGCCMRRPVVTETRNPQRNETNVCRNAQIMFDFDQPMRAETLRQNIVLAEEIAGANCPAGTTNVTGVQAADRGVRGWMAFQWNRLVSWMFGTEATAAFCVGGVQASVASEDVVVALGGGVTATRTRAYLTIQNALKPNARYQIVVKGDPDLADAVKRGVRSRDGVVMGQDDVWTFTTGNQVCAASQLNVQDTFRAAPNLFKSRNESHAYQATIVSQQGTRLVPIVPVREYAWTWLPWSSSRRDVATAGAGTLIDEQLRQSTTTVQSVNKNGSALIGAGIRVSTDTVFTPSTVGRTITGSQLATVLLCERPWPFATGEYAGTTRFEDRRGSAVLRGTAFEAGPYFNFATLYCMDGASAQSTMDDLPAMSVRPVPLNDVDRAKGIRRQYFFTYETAGTEALQRDGIGIRVIENPLHYSPLEWYRAQGFTGQPKAVTVDGYEAVQDGTTYYVAAVNTDDDPFAGNVSTTIYVLSYNDGAQETTRGIFQQLVDNWTFNVNLTRGMEGTCVAADGQPMTRNGQVVPCVADWECAKSGVVATCANLKPKLQRDIVRISDFQKMNLRLATAFSGGGQYPNMSAGTFVPGMTTSKWPSWEGTLGTALGGSLPVDPVNRLITCGRCKDGSGRLGDICQDSSECATGSTCVNETGNVPASGFDPQTCWNAQAQQAMCPTLESALGAGGMSRVPSRFYQYRALDGGVRYELATELEGPGADRYDPPLIREVKACVGSSRLCVTDADCVTYAADGRTVLRRTTCAGTGGRWVYNNMCTGQRFGNDNVCGNRVIGAGEVCEVGDLRATACTLPDGRAGQKVQQCVECRGFSDAPSTICVPVSSCGNGIVERRKCFGGNGFKYGQTCSADTDCRDARDPAGTVMTCQDVPSPEVCDDGALNGTYGRCNRTCSGLGASCGDGQISGGESCDNGASNGAYCDTRTPGDGGAGCNLASSCGLDCRSQGPSCGNGTVDGPEQCDGGTQSTEKALCAGGVNDNQPCGQASDCPGGTCGGVAGREACTSVRRCTNDPARSCAADADCGTGICATYPAAHNRTCGAPRTANACRYGAWSGCEPVGGARCGDGRVDAGEECDDGNTNNGDACTASCRRNICGDGIVNAGIEECDRGSENGGSCSSEYGVSCLACSRDCRNIAQSGGYCGDGTRNGAEQCDRSDIPSGVSCRSLGYDFAQQVQCRYTQYATDAAGNVVCTSDEATIGFKCLRCSQGGVEGVAQDFGRCDTASCARGGCRYYPGSGVGGRGDVVATLDSRFKAACLAASPPQEILSCGNTCGLGGCGRCSDTLPAGQGATVQGQVFDAVYSFVPVPNARVTLYAQGVRVTETFTDEDGRFRVTGLHPRTECGGYRIVVDSYRDNPCTALSPTAARPACGGSPRVGNGVNEATNGGYWPFESRLFSATNFATAVRNSEGKIFLIPRVGQNETLAVANWNGSLPGSRYLDAHLKLPQGYLNGLGPNIYWGAPGNVNVTGTNPHAYLYCFHSENPADTSCGSFQNGPQSIKYRRGTWARSGHYAYGLNDWGKQGMSAAVQYMSRTIPDVIARIVTQDQYFEVIPPSTPPSCGSAGSLWLVMAQNAASGQVTIFNQTGATGESVGGRFVCNGETIPELGGTVSASFHGL